LICAAQRGNTEIVQILIDNKANLDLQDKVNLSNSKLFFLYSN